MKLLSHLAFQENCETTLHFYKDIFDAEVPTLVRFKDAPQDVMYVPEDSQNLIMHATLEFQDYLFMMSDTIEKSHFVKGSNYCISISVESEEENLLF